MQIRQMYLQTESLIQLSKMQQIVQKAEVQELDPQEKSDFESIISCLRELDILSNEHQVLIKRLDSILADQISTKFFLETYRGFQWISRESQKKALQKLAKICFASLAVSELVQILEIKPLPLFEAGNFKFGILNYNLNSFEKTWIRNYCQEALHNLEQISQETNWLIGRIKLELEESLRQLTIE